MAEPQPPEKKVKVPTKPPQRYPPELPTTEGIPPEVQTLLEQQPDTVPSLAWFLDYWQRTNPQGLYEVKLAEYLQKIYKDRMTPIEEQYQSELQTAKDDDDREIAEQIYLEKAKKVQDFISGIERQTTFKRNMNFPVQDMPFYDEINTRLVSPAIEGGYKQFVNQRRLEQMAAQQEEQDYLKEYEKYATGVASKAIGAEQRGRYADYLQVQEAMRNPSSPQARRILQSAVEQGMISNEEAFGPGSEWERWQQGQAGGGAGNQGAENTRQMYERQWAGAAQKQARYNKMAEQSRILAAQYPDIYQNWLVEQNKMYGSGTKPVGWEGQFANWRPGAADVFWENQAKTAGFPTTKDYELDLWQKYGDIYGEYGRYRQGTKEESPVLPLEQWIEQNPELKAIWTARQERMKSPRQPYARWK